MRYCTFVITYDTYNSSGRAANDGWYDGTHLLLL